MNKLLTATAVAVSLAFSGTALAGHKHGKKSYQDTAKVISVKPIYRTVQVSTPHRNAGARKFAAAGLIITAAIPTLHRLPAPFSAA